VNYRPESPKHPEPWELDAACLNHPTPDIFHPEGLRPDLEPALAICRTCPVTNECFSEAIKTRSSGIWGGRQVLGVMQ